MSNLIPLIQGKTIIMKQFDLEHPDPETLATMREMYDGRPPLVLNRVSSQSDTDDRGPDPQ